MIRILLVALLFVLAGCSEGEICGEVNCPFGFKPGDDCECVPEGGRFTFSGEWGGGAFLVYQTSLIEAFFTSPSQCDLTATFPIEGNVQISLRNSGGAQIQAGDVFPLGPGSVTIARACLIPPGGSEITCFGDEIAGQFTITSLSFEGVPYENEDFVMEGTFQFDLTNFQMSDTVSTSNGEFRAEPAP